MELGLLVKQSACEWHIPAQGNMRVPGVIYADEALIQGMDHKVYEQIVNVASLPGIVQAGYAMPDAHWGYGFPIGGVAAFDPDAGGIVSAGGVGFDISCGVRLITTGLTRAEVMLHQRILADLLFNTIPAGLGSRGAITLSDADMDKMLLAGARWAVRQGWGVRADLERIEEHGCVAGAVPEEISAHARERQRREMGTLGSGNHYLEVQTVAGIFDSDAAAAMNLFVDGVVISIHCGSRGLGHQVGSEFLKSMAIDAARYGIQLPDRELACAPINSATGQRYLGAMRAAANCALANRQILTHLARQVFSDVFPGATLEVMYDVSHNTCKEEWHDIDGVSRRLFVHRKGATRAFGPGHPDVPVALREIGQPVLIGGSMGTCSFVMVGGQESEHKSLSSACHGAGRAMSRTRASKIWSGRQVIDELAGRGILIRSPSQRGVSEEAPGAYKDVTQVVDVAERAGLARKVARLEPLVCIKG